MAVTQLTSKPVKKSVADPSDAYISMLPLWKRSRAVLQGETTAKNHDKDVNEDGNLLIGFSPSMSQSQFEFFKTEAELPGLTAQYSKILVSSLLRKESVFKVNVDSLSEEENKDIHSWIKDDFTMEGQSMFSFMDASIWEELQTFNSWVYVDVAASVDEDEEVIPYATMYKAENVINVQLGVVPSTGKRGVTRFITRYLRTEFTDENPWHPSYIDTVVDHHLDATGGLVMDFWEKRDAAGNAVVENGEVKQDLARNAETKFVKYDTVIPEKHGERLGVIPAWPFNGQFQSSEPALMPLIDREIALYNKVSRRNHLMYGASTYTPVVTGVQEDDQDAIIRAGLGSWLFLPEDSSIDILATPSGALSDMEATIAATVEEMAKMGMRMLSPETAQSGVALELRNASQTAQLGTLNTKISEVMTEVIAFMIGWRYDVEITASDVNYSLSADFTPVASGSDSMRLVTEWYQGGLIARSTFLAIARYNDFIPVDYDDDVALNEIETDPLTTSSSSNDTNAPEDEDIVE